ncbi:type II inositol-1,4,5-trisphosphate 5-phosphatase-like protein [Cricetulus griseus]|nr:type II inositol-1,4,5-trisphosphate 5-phosphatase-like protein [Cricetulus griseus]
METILEQQRRYHEEKERLMDVMAKEMLTKKSTVSGPWSGTHPEPLSAFFGLRPSPRPIFAFLLGCLCALASLRDQINSDHRTRAMQDRYMEVSGNLRDLYDDKDGLRKEELNAISGPNEFAEFYNRLKQIKEFHRKHPNEHGDTCLSSQHLGGSRHIRCSDRASSGKWSVISESLTCVIPTDLVEFTDEEGYGRYLDLHDCYLKYINLKASEKLDYITYLSIFDQLFDIPKERKNAEYKRYLEMLLEYLQDYTDRVKPLQDQNELFGKIQTDFEKKWDNGTFPGWPKETSSALTHAGAHLDLSAFSSWEELASLGLDRLKSALLALGLKCGGTLEERAQRLFSTKGKSLESLDTSLFAKNPKSKGTKRDTERNKDIAFLEAQIYEYVEILGEQRQLTHENVQRKQARTGEEREEEEEEQISESESEDEENEIIYNPKNLPLGWDGKPIPYWLYKLHGLNINYNCEICGNYTYRGPKAFQRHFAEWRHAHGMRCLGIPNTAHFANVTQIEDAVSLWAKLKLQKASERWQPDTEEEYEDSSGNVVNKKTYEDLKRQGLLYSTAGLPVSLESDKRSAEPCSSPEQQAVQGVLCKGDSRQSRLLGLVRYRLENGAQEHALFLYTHRRMAITGDDVSLDQIVPLSRDFMLEEVSPDGELYILGSDVTVQLDTAELRLVFQLPFGSHTRMFLQEVARACPACGEALAEFPNVFSKLYKFKKLLWQQVLTLRPGIRSFCGFLDTCAQSQMLSRRNRASGTRTRVTGAGSRPLEEAGGSNLDSSRPNGRGLLMDQSSGARCQDKPDNSVARQNKSKSEITDMVRSSTITVSDKAHILSMQKFGLRDTMVKSHLVQKEEDYTYIQNFRFFVGTYNVNGQSPKECLRPWLSHSTQAPDVYCVGFQELDLSKEAFFFHDTPKEEEWFKAVSESLHPGAKYAKVKLIRLVGIMLLLYVKQEHAAHISEVEAETVGTGIMGRMGNKGGVAIRFQLHNTSICVVNSHLAAHTEEYERRNQDYKDICSRMQFSQVDPSLPPLTISKHDVILWLGDLNYRIEELDVEKVKALIEEKAFQTLYAYDQLKIQVAAKTVFEGFTEGELTFQPTYKYDTGSDDWDTSEKCRAPAWCDRVLWKGKNISQLSYQSHMALKTSDHKPVSSVFDIGVRVVNEELYRKTLEEIVRSLDKMENANIPSVSLSKREFCFENVKYMQLQTESFTIHNGQVPCQFEFINKPDEKSYCKQWLTAKPSKGFLLPDSHVEIELELFVNKATATKLNSGEDKIEDILVLHLERGKDYFLSVSGNYLPSCFGSPIHTLCFMREPILDLPLETVSKLTLMPVQTADDRSQLENPMEIPKELWMMIDYLYRNAIRQEDLFQQPGLRTEFEHIRDCLDTGMIDNLCASNHSVAEALLLFLESLPEPVICYSAYHNCLECSGNYTASKQVISTLPTFHKNVFNYLMSFLQELLKNSAENHLDENILASIFGSLLLRNPAGRQKLDMVEKKKAQEFIHQFLCSPV